VNKGYTTNINPPAMVERSRTEVWDFLDEVIRDHPVLLNGPDPSPPWHPAFMPVLSRLGGSRFTPWCSPPSTPTSMAPRWLFTFRSSAARSAEAKNLMMFLAEILSAADGHPVVAPTQDVVLGCYWLTAARGAMLSTRSALRVRTFSSENEVVLALESKVVKPQEWIPA